MRPPLGTSVMVLVVLLAGCVEEPEALQETASGPPSQAQAAGDRVETVVFDGELTGTPLQPSLARHEVVVPPGATEVKLVLNWSTAAFDINVTLVDPDGKEAGSGFKETSTSRAVATIEPPADGAWSVFVGSKQALREKYKLTVSVSDIIPGAADLSQVMKMPAQGFAELNLIMEANASFEYAWAIREAGNPTYFNIHSHQDGKTVRHVEETAEKLDGAFTAPTRQVYSLLWRNTGVSPLSVQVDVDGAFRIHSETHHS